MVRTCTICAHPDVQKINEGLLSGASYRSIAEQFGVSASAVFRHKESHIPEVLLRAGDIQEVVDANNSVATLERVQTKAFELLDMAIDAGDTKTYGAPSNYLREIREQIKLWAELEGRLATQPMVNILVAPEWIELKNQIVTALKPYPIALEAVRNALQ